jgi:phosphoribosylformimino-5-aminoimidazole carboxamide ribotide isomerase
MIIIPAVDIKGGKCVRLLQGRMDAETVFGEDPVAIARKWEAAGASLIHVVDLDGAIKKSPQNLAPIRKIVEQVKTPIQVGGGIRNEDTVQMYMDMGVSRAVIGTEAIRNPTLIQRLCKRYPGRIVVAIDARNGRVAIEGWTETTGVEAVTLAKQFEDVGVAAINFTDIYRDGMQTGPNIEETRRLAAAVRIPVVASGGVSTLEDIKNIFPLNSCGVTGIIVGKALYSGSLDLKIGLEWLKSTHGQS